MQIIIFVRYSKILEKAQLFLEKYTHEKASVFYALPQSGSSRQNFFATSVGKDFIITYNDNLPENDSFLYLSSIFSDLKLNTPHIFKVSEDRKMYIQEHLGKRTLSDIIEKEGCSDRVKSIVKQSLTRLYELQQRTRGQIDFSRAFEYERYDELPIQNDLFYFKSFIADVLEIPYHKSTLLKEFRDLTLKLEQLKPRCLMIRDFQSRNMMVNDRDEVFFIDYQSAMEGPAMYDVISFLYQAKANFPDDFRDEMLKYYFSHYEDAAARQLLDESLNPLKLIRFMQVLGAYGFRGLIQRKSHFMSSLSAGIVNLCRFAVTWDEIEAYPELKKLIQQLKTEESKNKIEAILNKT
jgi:aminoglycoside/choline kinase family phosphotransferase